MELRDNFNQLLTKERPTYHIMKLSMELVENMDNNGIIELCELLDNPDIELLIKKSAVYPLVNYCVHSPFTNDDVKFHVAKLMETTHPDSPWIEKWKS